MKGTEVLADAYGRVREVVHETVEGLTAEELNARVDPRANSIAWLVWHLTRVQDDHVADASGQRQVWHAANWMERLGLSLPAADTGYGHTAKQVATVRVDSAGPLLEYHDAVHEQTLRFLRSLAAADLDRVIDTRWDPPVTLGVRLISVISDDLQHAGQAAYVRGLLKHR
ncbi:DinB family protein [Streptomyces sp. NBC_01565]|uniref:mycothiol transferase n=1 Tax=unclassified Streptomyces TaxID=2593676 RepID=UPI0022587ED3|nr:DinB family protein [Streptomyces sp. NBC_01565]MCX4539620.1 DinB family protein [Streptomyces sp. NBC_01565]